jgi:hypothetical protein
LFNISLKPYNIKQTTFKILILSIFSFIHPLSKALKLF